MSKPSASPSGKLAWHQQEGSNRWRSNNVKAIGTATLLSRTVGERVRRSLNTTDRKLAQELYDQLRAKAWRVNKLGEVADHTFDEACLRWLTEKEEKRSLDDDRTKIEFFLQHFTGKNIASITEDHIVAAVAKMPNKKHLQRWQARRDSAERKGTPIPAYVAKPVSAATHSQHLSFMRGC